MKRAVKPRIRYGWRSGWWVMACGVNLFGRTMDECLAKCRARL